MGMNMRKSTQELLKLLNTAPHFSDYIENEEDNLIKQTSLCQYLNTLLDEKNITKSQMIKLSGLDRTYAYQILSGNRKNPDRDKVLAICFSLKLSFEETQNLLKSTGYPILYARIKKDSILIFALQHKLTLADVNEILYDFDFNTLA